MTTTKPSETMTLEQFLDALDAHEGSVPIDELVALLERTKVGPEDVEGLMTFCDEHYQRNPLRKGDAYEALVMCWNPGQRSPIHDHAGSACGVKVIRGTMTEQVWDHVDGTIRKGAVNALGEGLVCGSWDTDTHEVINASSDVPLVTLHVYTPPLEGVGYYDEETGERTVHDYGTEAAPA